MTFCDVCGNEADSVGSVCPYCGNSFTENSTSLVRKKSFRQKTVNLESGKPIVEIALARMTEIIGDSARNGISVLTLIHGYGSSGKGGVIRSESRKTLDYLKSKGKIKEYIPGEEFNHRLGRVKELLNRYPQLKSDKNLNRGNKGITLVIL
jgi:uncharacterized membrane protein YvbJ